MSRIVPWMCREEWLTTYHNLYNFQDLKSQLKGIEKVQVWKSRCGGKIPLSVEITASLVAATTLDVKQSQKQTLTVRLTMAMAIVRFVNSMVDMEQKGVYARSVQSIADDIGLPDWLVDLRHEGTHAGLPSLEVLRVGCQFSLDWLREHYWESLIAEIQGRDVKLIELLQTFVEDYDVNVSKGGKKEMRKKKNVAMIKEIIELTCGYHMWDAVFDLLVGGPGLLFPSLETLKRFATYWPDIIEDSVETISMDLPKEALALWGPLLKALSKENEKFLSKLVTNLMKKVCKLENDSENVLLIRYVSCWVHHILLSANKESKEAKKWKIQAKLDYGVILEVSLWNCSSYTTIFMPFILDNLKHLSNTAKEKLEKFILIAHGTAHSITTSEDHKVPATMRKAAAYHRLAESFPRLADHIKSRLEKPTELRNIVWQPSDPSFLNTVPLGALLGCKPMQFELLELPEELDSMEVEASVDSMEVEASEVEENSAESTSELCEISNNYNSEVEESSGFKCDTMKELSESVIESIGQEIWLF